MDETVIEVQSGAGGDEALEFSDILLNMYMGWANLKQVAYYRVKGSDKIITEGDQREALIGHNGIHRYVRLSPFDDQHRWHTSFCQVNISGMGTYNNTNAVAVISYCLHPYEIAKNHLLGIETPRVYEVLAGHLHLLRYYNPESVVA